MFNKEDGPTALRADLVRGLSLSRGPQEVQTDKGVERAVACVASVWNGSRGFVVVLIRFLEPPSIERYMYAEALTDESRIIRAQAEALSFVQNLGFSMDEPAFRELDEESREKRLHNWNLIRKVRESSLGVEEAVYPAAVVEPSDESEPIPSVAPEPPEEDSLELALAGGPRDDDTPVDLRPLGDAPQDDDTPLALAPIVKRTAEDEGMELAPIDGAPSEDEPLELARVTEASPEDEALELAPANGAASSDDDSLQFEAEELDLSPVSDEPEDGESLEFEPLGDTAGPGDTQPIGVEPEELVLELPVPEAELDSAKAPVVDAIEPPAETVEAFEIEHEPDFLGASTEEESASEADVLEFVGSEPAASDLATIPLTTEFTPDQLSESAELEFVDSEPPGVESAAVAANEGRPTGERAAARDTGGAVIGKIELVRREGADRRRLTALGRLLSFF